MGIPLNLKRRTVTLVGAALTTAPRLTRAQRADTWEPSREVRLLTGFPPGGTTDIVARLLAEALRSRIGQAVVVDPRPGANGYIGARAAARATPDGHTLFLAQVGIMSIGPTVPGVIVGLDLDTELVPIACLVGTPMVLVTRPGAPFTNVESFIAHARSHPGSLTYASAGSGSINQLTMERFASLNGISLVHVPYRGGGPAALDLGTGRVDVMFATLAESLGPIRGGRMVPLALAGERPSAALPGPPLLATRFPGLAVLNWFGVVAPAGLSAAVRNYWEHSLISAIQDPATRQSFAERAFDPVAEDAVTFTRRIAEERASWRRAVDAAGIKAD